MESRKYHGYAPLPDQAQIKIFGDRTRSLVYLPEFLEYIRCKLDEMGYWGNGSNTEVDLDPDKQQLTTLLKSNSTVKTVGKSLNYLDDEYAKLNNQVSNLNTIVENESYENMVAHRNFEEQLSQMNGKVDTANTLAKKASQDVESLNYALDSVKDDFNTLRSTVEANEKRTDTLETNYDALSYDLGQFLIVVNQKFEEQQKEIDELKKTVSPMSLVASVSESFSTPINVGSFETKVITIEDESIKQGDLAMVSCEAGYTENGNLQYSASVLKDGEVNVYILNQSNVSLTVDKDINVKVVRFVA